MGCFFRTDFMVTEEMANLMIERRSREKYRMANIAGPFHPLEFNVMGVHRQASQQKTGFVEEPYYERLKN